MVALSPASADTPVRGPVVPPFDVSPLIVSGTHRLYGLQIKGLPSGVLVRAWRECPGVCIMRVYKISKHSEVSLFKFYGPAASSPFSLGDPLYVQVDARHAHDGEKPWGRLYAGRFVRDRDSGSGDTAFRKAGPLRCVPPGKDYRSAVSCRNLGAPKVSD